MVADRVAIARAVQGAAVHGPAVAEAYGLAGALPEDPQLLLNAAGNAESLLRSRKLAEQPKIKVMTLDLIAAADEIATCAPALRAAPPAAPAQPPT